MIRRAHYRNAQRTLERLLGLDVLPVVNENDTVATDEIRVGDNDRLAALVAHIVGADGLVLLSDVDGLYDGDPRRAGSRLVARGRRARGPGGGDGRPLRWRRPRYRRHGHQDHRGGDGVGVRGSRCCWPRPRTSGAALDTAGDGPKVGTAFRPSGRRMSARRFWLRHAADVRGRLDLDRGATTAVLHRRRSLLAAGIRGVSGDFVAGDVVDLVDPDGTVVARGVVGFDATELPDLIGRSSHELPSAQRREVVHADDLVPVHTP